MSGKCLLDTNVVIALFAGESAIVDYLKGAEEVFVPSVVIGELYYGARKSSRVADNVARIDDFAASNVVLSCDTATAYRYGEVKNSLREKGRPIPENDIWIAAIALQHDLILLTSDAHFSEVENLRLEDKLRA
jgi:tRNA(fMet)-specific endonuclease VapC